MSSAPPASPPTQAPAGRPGYFTSLYQTLRKRTASALDASFVPLVSWLIGSVLVVFIFVYITILPHWTGVESGRALKATMHAGAYASVSLAPLAIMTLVSLLMRRSRQARLERREALEALPTDLGGMRLPQVARDRVRAEWAEEKDRGTLAGDRTVHYGILYGLVGTVVLSAVVWIGGETILTGAVKGIPHRVNAAYAIGAAAVINILREFTRMLIRAAARDGSAKAFAWATRRLVLTVASVMGLVSLASLGLFSGLIERINADRFSWIALGIVVGIVGDLLLEVIAERAGNWLGVVPLKRNVDASLNQIDGLDPEDILRLQEEGIATLQTLGLSSTPRLYFLLPYSLREILEWQDQAQLLLHFGPSRANFLREHANVKRMSDVWMSAAEFVRADTRTRTSIAQRFGYSNDTDALRVFEQIVRDGNVLRLLLYRNAYMPPADVPTPSPTGHPAPSHAPPGSS